MTPAGVIAMPVAEQKTEPVETTTVAVQAEVKRERMTMMDMIKAAGVVGVGAVLAIYLVPKIQGASEAKDTFIQQEMIKSAREQGAALQAAAAAQTAAATAMGDMSESIDDMTDQQQELLTALTPLVKQLDRVADAVQAQTKAEQLPAENP